MSSSNRARTLSNTSNERVTPTSMTRLRVRDVWTTDNREVRSLVNADGTVEVSIVAAEAPPPGPDDVVVRIEAAPINPTDLGMLFAGADVSNVRVGHGREAPTAVATVPEVLRPVMARRVGHALPVGVEGAGTVVASGSSPAAKALVGKTVAVYGGAMYTRYRTLPASACLVLREGTSAEAGASCFVNPLTALGMVETMKAEGHHAIVHTAAASNLGQMLHRICEKDDIALVNIVRRTEQVTILRELGAKHVCNTSAPDFKETLTKALIETGATIAFDAIGGGPLLDTILTCMEAACIERGAGSFKRYGSDVHKQGYVYGRLDPSPTILNRRFGLAWGVGGWLLDPFLAKIGQAAADRLRERVAAEVETTFVSHYTRKISLAEVASPDVVRGYGRMCTGEKYLILPQS
jgi:NADPH2:quinone reductase